jgi:hypothetical protein
MAKIISGMAFNFLFMMILKEAKLPFAKARVLLA